MLCTRSSCNKRISMLESTMKPYPLSDGMLLSMKDKDQWHSEERHLRLECTALVKHERSMPNAMSYNTIIL